MHYGFVGRATHQDSRKTLRLESAAVIRSISPTQTYTLTHTSRLYVSCRYIYIYNDVARCYRFIIYMRVCAWVYSRPATFVWTLRCINRLGRNEQKNITATTIQSTTAEMYSGRKFVVIYFATTGTKDLRLRRRHVERKTEYTIYRYRGIKNWIYGWM